MSDQLPNHDEQVVVKLPEEASLDDLIAGLEASWGGAASAKPPAEQPAPVVEETPPPPQRQERRGAERREPHQFKVELRLAVAGFPMRLVNLSSTGLLAETNQRLCPGRTVDVFLRYGGVRKVLRATVIRSSMHAVAPNPVFRAALQFEEPLVLQDADL
jgi:hypothetical protein